jgi:hypothetical protein
MIAEGSKKVGFDYIYRTANQPSLQVLFKIVFKEYYLCHSPYGIGVKIEIKTHN